MLWRLSTLRLGSGIPVLVATFMATAILGGAALQWPVGHYPDSHGRRLVLLWVCISGAVVTVAVFVLAGVSVDFLLPLSLLFGGLIFSIYGLGVAHVNDVIDSSRLVEFAGGLLPVHGVGAAIGPVLVGPVLDVAGPASLMLFYAAVMAALAVHSFKRIHAAGPVAVERKGDFVAMGAGSQVVLRMDPPL